VVVVPLLLVGLVVDYRLAVAVVLVVVVEERVLVFGLNPDW
jgi:hypothetical protein